MPTQPDTKTPMANGASDFFSRLRSKFLLRRAPGSSDHGVRGHRWNGRALRGMPDTVIMPDGTIIGPKPLTTRFCLRCSRLIRLQIRCRKNAARILRTGLKIRRAKYWMRQERRYQWLKWKEYDRIGNTP